MIVDNKYFYHDKLKEFIEYFEKFVAQDLPNSVEILWRNHSIYFNAKSKCNNIINRIKFKISNGEKLDIKKTNELFDSYNKVIQNMDYKFHKLAVKTLPSTIKTICSKIESDIEKTHRSPFDTSSLVFYFLEHLTAVSGDVTELLSTMKTAEDELEYSLAGLNRYMSFDQNLGSGFQKLIEICKNLQEATIHSRECLKDDFQFLIVLPYDTAKLYLYKEKKLIAESLSLFEFCKKNSDNPLKILLSLAILKDNVTEMHNIIKKSPEFGDCSECLIDKDLESKIGEDLIDFFVGLTDSKGLLEFCLKNPDKLLHKQLLNKEVQQMCVIFHQISAFLKELKFVPHTIKFDNPLITCELKLEPGTLAISLFYGIDEYLEQMKSIYISATKIISLLHQCQYAIDNPGSLHIG